MAYFEVNKKPPLTFPTLTGSIVTFNSQYALPLKSHTVNINSVSGVSDINITRTGKNLCPTAIMGKSYVPGSGEDTTSSAAASTVKFPFDKDKTYVFTKNCNVRAMMFAWDAQDNFVGRITGSDVSPRVFTKSSFSSGNGTQDFDSIVKIAIRFYESDGQSIDDVIGAEYQVEIGDTATAYEAYNGTTTTITIGSTINEGMYDARTGILEVTLPSVQTIQLPPCPIDALKGVNNIWADTGDTTLQYPKFG